MCLMCYLKFNVLLVKSIISYSESVKFNVNFKIPKLLFFSCNTKTV